MKISSDLVAVKNSLMCVNVFFFFENQMFEYRVLNTCLAHPTLRFGLEFGLKCDLWRQNDKTSLALCQFASNKHILMDSTMFLNEDYLPNKYTIWWLIVKNKHFLNSHKIRLQKFVLTHTHTPLFLANVLYTHFIVP